MTEITINESDMTVTQLLGTNSPLGRGTIVIRRNGDDPAEYATLHRFIYRNGEEAHRVRLLNLRRGAVETFDLTDVTGAWTVKRDDEGVIATCDEVLINLAQSVINQSHEAERLQKDVRTQQSDWEKMNEFLLDEAERRDWCGELEKVLDTWNAAFETFELQGRSKTYVVEVEVTATYTVNVRVDDCKDEDAAIEVVNDMDTWELMQNSYDGEWSAPDDAEFNVQGATVDS